MHRKGNPSRVWEYIGVYQETANSDLFYVSGTTYTETVKQPFMNRQ
jgi:hypothetical protein